MNVANGHNTSIFTSRTSAFHSRTTTLFVTNVNNNKSSGINVVIDPSFKDLLVELMEILAIYAVGDFALIKTVLTADKFITLSRSLGRIVIIDPTYKLLQTSALSSLQGLQRAYVQNTQLTEVTDKLAIAENRAAILDNMDLLREYINDLNTQTHTSVFGDYTISAAVPALIPEAYLIYIQRHGFPSDGVFDVEKLAKINVS
jgi:hypothetical protein